MVGFGSLGAILAIGAAFAAIIALIAVAGKYTGLNEVFSMILNTLGHFMRIVLSVFQMAPKFVQIGIFLVLGLSLMGLATSWFMASDVVCSQGNVWQANGIIPAMSAKMIDDVKSPEMAMKVAVKPQYGSSFGFAKDMTNAIFGDAVAEANATSGTSSFTSHTGVDGGSGGGGGGGGAG